MGCFERVRGRQPTMIRREHTAAVVGVVSHERRHVAMPMGGIGTGQVSICGNGSLRQCEIFNQANHLGFVPDSFFAVSASLESTERGTAPGGIVRLLQSQAALDSPDGHTPLVNDDVVPDQQWALLQRFARVERTTFTGAYPFARIAYHDSGLPIEIELEAYSPFIPHGGRQTLWVRGHKGRIHNVLARLWRSCPPNCTHVWNYEQAISRLFPRLERTMRETDLNVSQAPDGYTPHRTLVPLFLRQLWDEPIGGPLNPALDGMLGTVLKVYREVRQGAGLDWLGNYWPRVRRLIAYIERKWDPDGDGILDGGQPNTFDIAFYGPNRFIGGLWLAALRAGEELARLAGDDVEGDRSTSGS